MRPVWAAAIGAVSAGVLVAFLYVAASKPHIPAAPGDVQREQSRREGRAEGLRRATEAIQRGEPYILAWNGAGDLSPEGLGIDTDTGLPLRNCSLVCPTGVDVISYEAEVDACNEAIRRAWRAGELKGFDLRPKLRTKAMLRKLFASSAPTLLARDGDSIRTADGSCSVTYRYMAWPDGSESRYLRLKTPQTRGEGDWIVYPCGYVDRPGVLYMTEPPPPFEGMVVDDGTTAILRDADRYVWVIDLPHGLVVQVVGPIQ